MDLHDYKDVADNYDRYLEVMYSGENDKHEGFQEFYLKLAQQYGGGGVVDIACGTGAVLLYLAERGIDIDGTDLSEEMCRVAAEKAERMGLSLNIFPADMTKFSSGKKYSLAIIARSGFMHLPDSKLQAAALRNIREQLADGGILTFNTFDPWPPMQAQQMLTNPEKDYAFRLEYVNSEGHREKIYNAITYNPYTQQMYGNWKFETCDDQGNVIGERIRPLLMRETYRSEIFLLAELCGFEVIDIYRGYQGDKEDLNDISTAPKYRSNLIWILRKR
ncbi:MAG: class I SAM-dependent methyltransferase [Lachnospiraceae bacterium]|nr:class I SAM-dependent methyltransferase [Lachnospiraceae bacterium]